MVTTTKTGRSHYRGPGIGVPLKYVYLILSGIVILVLSAGSGFLLHNLFGQTIEIRFFIGAFLVFFAPAGALALNNLNSTKQLLAIEDFNALQKSRLKDWIDRAKKECTVALFFSWFAGAIAVVPVPLLAPNLIAWIVLSVAFFVNCLVIWGQYYMLIQIHKFSDEASRIKAQKKRDSRIEAEAL